MSRRGCRGPPRSGAKAVVIQPGHCHALTPPRSLPLNRPPARATGGLFGKAQREESRVNNIFFLVVETFKYRQRAERFHTLPFDNARPPAPALLARPSP